MANITQLRSDTADTRTIERAKHVHGMLTAERWSITKAAEVIGMNKSVLASRLKGNTAFLADELELLAGLLKKDPLEFYAAYISAGEWCPPSDSNRGPTDYRGHVSPLNDASTPVISLAERRKLKNA